MNLQNNFFVRQDAVNFDKKRGKESNENVVIFLKRQWKGRRMQKVKKEVFLWDKAGKPNTKKRKQLRKDVVFMSRDTKKCLTKK